MLVILQRAADLPIALPEVKLALRVGFDDDDATIEGLIRSEIRRYEDFTRRFIFQTEVNACFVRWQTRYRIDAASVREILSVSYFAQDAEWYALSAESWAAVPSSDGGLVVRIADAADLPVLGETDHPVAIRFLAGADLPGDAQPVSPLDPADRGNVLHLVKHLFDHDDPLDERAMIARMGGRRLMW